jgi:hypothetical protein
LAAAARGPIATTARDNHGWNQRQAIAFRLKEEDAMHRPVPDRSVARKFNMAICDVCGNDYDKAFRVTQAGKTMTFDSFECAIHAMAPRCVYCDCPVIGHGVEAGGAIYCCAHCAQHSGVKGVSDRAA